MNAISPAFELEQEQEAKGSVGGPRSLSAEMRIFVDAFLGNGGNATAAALAAGVDPDKAAMQACRWLCREAVANHIKNQVGRFAQSTIPLAIRTLVEIAGDPEALRKDRIKAANSLLDIAGMTSAPGGVQVNVGIVNGSEAQRIIADVHNRRAARMSDIPPAMSDTMQRDLHDIEALALPAPDGTPGGDQLQGPAGATGPIPVPSPTKSAKSAVSCECPKCREGQAPALDGDGFEAFGVFGEGGEDG